MVIFMWQLIGIQVFMFVTKFMLSLNRYVTILDNMLSCKLLQVSYNRVFVKYEHFLGFYRVKVTTVKFKESAWFKKCVYQYYERCTRLCL